MKIAIIILLLLSMVSCSSNTGKKDLTGKIIQKYPNGQIKEVILYEGNKEIARNIYNENGEIVKKVGNVPDGVIRIYYENGIVMSEFTKKKGKMNGLFKMYYDDGKLLLETNFIDDKLDFQKEYRKDGKLKVQSDFEDGKITKSRSYDNSGKEISSQKYSYKEKPATPESRK